MPLRTAALSTMDDAAAVLTTGALTLVVKVESAPYTVPAALEPTTR